jgi:hypothetical protein
MLQYQCEQLDKTFRWWFFHGSLAPGLSTCFAKSDASTYYLKFIKSTTPGDQLFQQMGILQKKSPNSSISTFDIM